MFTLYDEEEVQRIHLESETRKARERGMAQGIAEGMAQGMVEGTIKTCRRLGLSLEAAARMLATSSGMSQEEAFEAARRLWE